MKESTRFRDPIYGFIDNISEYELQIIDSPLFQRLRRIHQLALTKYIYPRAEHSRFVHSLGVMHCATQMYEAILKGKKANNYENKLKVLRFAALLHDIGHLPFSHATENVLLKNLKHENLSIYIIKNAPCIKNIISNAGVNPNHVASLLSKKERISEYNLESKLLSGVLDADRADYLVRDSHNCGVSYGKYDLARYKNIFSFDETENKLFVAEKDICIAEAMLIARYHYNLQVIHHRTRVGYNIVLEKFLENHKKMLYKISNKNEILSSEMDLNLKEFELFDDYSIFECAKKEYSKKQDTWASYCLRYKHLVPVLDVTFQIKKDEDLYKNFIFELENHYPKLKDYCFFKKTSQDIIEITDSEIFIRRRLGGDVDIKEYSTIFKELTKKPTTFARVYVKPEKKDDVLDVLKKCVSYVDGQ